MKENTSDYTLMVAELRDRFFEQAALRRTPEEMQLIREAYFFAEEAHKHQKRKTGEPYITHPIAVAAIVSEQLRLGTSPVIAALLHDVVEDTPHSVEEIRKRSGRNSERT